MGKNNPLELSIPDTARGKGVLLAISGGLDSMCLLHAMTRWQARHPDFFRSLHVAHVHHGLRDSDADADAALVERYCRQTGTPCHVIALNGLGLDGKPLRAKGGLEARAREARYYHLKQLRDQLRLDWIATAHHRDDQIETLTLRVLRGTSLAGLRGIHALRADGVWRPLLGVSRADLLDYARRYEILWREDRSNRDLRYARNRIRHILLPLLRRRFPDYEERLLSICRLTGAFLDKFSPDPESWNISVRVFPASATPIPETDTTRRVILDLHRVFPDGCPDTQLLRVRYRREGDLFSPPGMSTTTRKLKKFFQERRLPQKERERKPLLTLGSTVLWIPGLAVSGYHKPHPRSAQLIEITIDPRAPGQKHKIAAD